jgi:hypothetical protein
MWVSRAAHDEIAVIRRGDISAVHSKTHHGGRGSCHHQRRCERSENRRGGEHATCLEWMEWERTKTLGLAARPVQAPVRAGASRARRHAMADPDGHETFSPPPVPPTTASAEDRDHATRHDVHSSSIEREASVDEA